MSLNVARSVYSVAVALIVSLLPAAAQPAVVSQGQPATIVPPLISASAPNVALAQDPAPAAAVAAPQQIRDELDRLRKEFESVEAAAAGM